MAPNPPPHNLSAAEPPSSASSPPHLRKRRFSGQFSPGDAIATSTPSPAVLDLPSLSECHVCGFRIGIGRGKHRLQALYSEWRIVLLCKNCLVLVESSRICSYCFAEASADCYRCRACERSVHRSCFSAYSRIAPWSYSCSGSEFSLCVDCWVPKSMASRGSESRRIGEKSDNARVSYEEDEVDRLEGVVKDATCALEMEFEVAKRASYKAVEKTSMAMMANEKAGNALDLVAKMGGDGAKVVDCELSEIQLHRTVNSSPRTAGKLQCASLSGYAVRRVSECDGDLSARVLDSGSPCVRGELEACTIQNLQQNPDESISEPSTCDRDSSPSSLINMKCLKVDCMVDVTTGLKDDGAFPGQCDAEDENAVPLKEGEGSRMRKSMNSIENDICVASESLPSPEQDMPTELNAENCNCKYDRYLNKYGKRIKFTNLSRNDDNMDQEQDKSTEANAETCNYKTDRFLIKYKKRNKFITSHGDDNCMDREQHKSAEANVGDCNLEPDRFLIKYRKMNKLTHSSGNGNSMDREQDRSTESNAGDCNFEFNRILIKYKKRSKFITSPRDDNSMDREQDKSTETIVGDCNSEPDRLFIKYRKMNKLIHLSRDGNSMDREQDRSTEANAGDCNFEFNRFLIKYKKRNLFITSLGDDNSMDREQDKSTEANCRDCNKLTHSSSDGNSMDREQDMSTEAIAGDCNFELNRFLIKYRKRNKFMTSPGDDNSMGRDQDKSTEANVEDFNFEPDRFLIKYRKRNMFMNSSGDENVRDSEFIPNPEQNNSQGANAGNCSLKPDRFLIKYHKRRSALKTIQPSSKTKFVNKGFHQKCQTHLLDYYSVVQRNLECFWIPPLGNVLKSSKHT